MKNYLYLILILWGTSSLNAQVFVNEVNINDLEHVQYVELLGAQSLSFNKILINIDYGQKQKLFKEPRVKDGSGKNMKFNSMIDALNFMAMNGWEYVNNYQVRDSEKVEYHYLLRRAPKKVLNEFDED